VSFASALGPTLAALGWKHAWAIDFEFIPHRGDLPDPVVCMAAHCVITGEKRDMWFGRKPYPPCPFDMTTDELFVAHSAQAEVSCFLQLGWPMPTRVLDTMVEMARLWNGKMVKQPGDDESILTPSLLRSLAYFGIPTRSSSVKDAAIALILRGVRTPEEIASTLAYCADDADDVAKLLAALMFASDLADPLRFRQATCRGWNVATSTVVEATGTPLNMPLVKRFLTHWEAVEKGLFDTLSRDYPGVFRGDRSLDLKGFAEYISFHKIPWPLTPKTGMPVIEDKVLEEQARLHPDLLKNLIALLKLKKVHRLGVGDLAIGKDGRNRTNLRSYATKTGRGAMSGSASVYLQSKWLRHFVQPPKRRALLILDWKSCEVAVAGVLSGCEALWEAAIAANTYETFGRQAGQSEEEAKKNRAILKITVLGILFGMTPQGIAHRNNIPLSKAMWLFGAHERAYPEFWSYSLGAEKHACEGKPLETPLGWRLWWPPQSRVTVKGTTARNWPIQSVAAEMSKLAVTLAVEAGKSVCAVVHDCLVIEVTEEHVERELAHAKALMDQASEIVLGAGRRVRIAPSVVFHPDRRVSKRELAEFEKAGVHVYLGRYADKDGVEMFETAMKLLVEVEEKAKKSTDIAKERG
jgi:hypothetical protein